MPTSSSPTPPWFFAPSLGPADEAVALDEREARHASGARRLRPGDEVQLFNGFGLVANARVDTLDANELVARVDGIEERPPFRPTLHLAAALPKGDRAATLVSMAAQLGMRSFTPLECERTVVHASESFAQRFDRIAVESCKQARLAYLPTYVGPRAPVEVIEALLPVVESALVAHPGGRPLATEPPGDATLLVIGPEGGFTDDEVEGMKTAGATPVSLGEGILRIETAAVAGLAWAGLAAATN